MRIRSRTITLLAVAAGHVLVLWSIWRVQAPRPDETETFASVLFFLPEKSGHSVVPRLPSSRVGTLRSAPHAAAAPPEAAAGSGITPPPVPGAGVDWSAQLGAAADATLRNEKAARDQLGALTRKFVIEADPRDPGRAPLQDFRWYGAGIHRIDTRSPIPVLHVNDRCVLVLFIIPACAIGHIEIHDDLFRNEARALDDREATPRPNDVP
ncbi:MAG TPA: hypothetical protein VMC02_10235 [Steroidobacteraceae bacterium]|nr:hypothetical protein [Steroidobacteraceae bacterium]